MEEVEKMAWLNEKISAKCGSLKKHVMFENELGFSGRRFGFDRSAFW